MDAATLPARHRATSFLDRVFDAYLGRPLPLVLIAALYAATSFALQQWADDATGRAFFRHVAALITENLVFQVGAFAATRIVQAQARDEPPGLLRVFVETAVGLPRLLAVFLLYTTGWLAFSLLFVVPGVVFAVGAAFAVNVLAATDTGGWAAVRRSRALTRGRWWRVFLTFAMLGLPIFLLAMFFQYLPRDAGHYWLHAGLTALLVPIVLAGQAVMFVDLEERHAADERERARRVLAASPPPAPAPGPPSYAAPSHARFDPGAFSAFEHRGWQRAASAYHGAFAPLTRQAADALLDAAGVGPGLHVLDTGTGPGFVAGLARERGAQVTGVDFSPEMLALARANHPGVEFRVADAEALPFPDRTFDAVTSAFLIGHLSHPDRAIAEAGRVLRPACRLALSWWQPFDRAVAFGIVYDAVRAFGRAEVPLPQGPPFDQFSDPDALARGLALAGFDDVRLSPVAMTWRAASGDEVFEAFLHGSVRTAGLLREQSPEQLLAIRAAVVRRVEEYRGPAGIDLPMPCWVASGVTAG